MVPKLLIGTKECFNCLKMAFLIFLQNFERGITTLFQGKQCKDLTNV